MALDYSMCFYSEFNLRRISQTIKNNLLTYEKGPVEEEKSGAFNTRFYYMTICSIGKDYRILLQEDLNINVNKSVVFRLDKFEDREAGINSMLRVVLSVLELSTGEATFIFNGDFVYLLRREGELLINNDLEFWTPERLAMVPIEYEMASLPMIL